MGQSPHVFSLRNVTPQVDRDGGSRLAVDASTFPILRGLSLYRAVLKPLGLREPHWHPNANELTYCLTGEAPVTIFSNGSIHDTFSVRAGEMFFVPSGYLHHFENTGTTEAEFIIAFSHERPEDYGISGAVGCMSNSVLGNTFGLPSDTFQALPKSSESTVFGLRKTPAKPSFESHFPDQHKFAAETMAPPIATSDGLAKTAKKGVLANPRKYFHVLTADKRHGHAGAALASTNRRDGLCSERPCAHDRAEPGSKGGYLRA